MRKFRLQEPERFTERALVHRIANRAERYERLIDASAPDVIINNERELLDAACGEWVHRRKGFFARFWK